MELNVRRSKTSYKGMNRIIVTLALTLCTLAGFAQGSVRGRILDKAHSTSIEFVNVVVTAKSDTTRIVGSAISDIDGKFNVKGLPDGTYTVTLSFMGYKPVTRSFAITAQNRVVS